MKQIAVVQTTDFVVQVVNASLHVSDVMDVMTARTTAMNPTALTAVLVTSAVQLVINVSDRVHDVMEFLTAMTTLMNSTAIVRQLSTGVAMDNVFQQRHSVIEQQTAWMAQMNKIVHACRQSSRVLLMVTAFLCRGAVTVSVIVLTAVKRPIVHLRDLLAVVLRRVKVVWKFCTVACGALSAQACLMTLQPKLLVAVLASDMLAGK
jgi:hypothetical protein